MSGIDLGDLRLLSTGLDVLDALLVVDVATSRNVLIGIAVLTLVELLAHHVIETAAAKEEDLLEGLAEVPIERRVDYRIEEAVRVAEPKKDAR